MKVMGDVTRLGEALDARAIPFMVVKGPVMAEVVYPRNDLRAYDDVDLVVPRTAVRGRHQLADRCRLRRTRPKLAVIRREMRGQVHMTARYGTSVDVHWHLLNRRSVRSALPDRHGRAVRARAARLAGRPRGADARSRPTRCCTWRCMPG